MTWCHCMRSSFRTYLHNVSRANNMRAKSLRIQRGKYQRSHVIEEGARLKRIIVSNTTEQQHALLVPGAFMTQKIVSILGLGCGTAGS